MPQSLIVLGMRPHLTIVPNHSAWDTIVNSPHGHRPRTQQWTCVMSFRRSMQQGPIVVADLSLCYRTPNQQPY
jgi:hypothetical protein